MAFIAEQDLQNYLAKGLARQGIHYLVEPCFTNSSCRADIVIANVIADIATIDVIIIEIKLHLNRSQLYMAYGQASLYRKLSVQELSVQEGLSMPRLWIIGQRPQKDVDYESAKRLAQTIVSTTSKCTVTFLKLNIDPDINLNKQFFTFPRKPLNASSRRVSIIITAITAKIGCQKPDF